MAEREIFSELQLEDLELLDRQRGAVRALARMVLGEETAIDLDVLQRLVDAGAVAPDDTWRLQALGVCFGDLLAEREPALHWGIIEDEWGRDPTLRWEDTTVNLNALTMISKRIEDGEHPELEYLAREAMRMSREMVEKYRRLGK